MICYFSATGNSRHVANRLAQSLNEPVISVLDVLGKPVFVEDRMLGKAIAVGTVSEREIQHLSIGHSLLKTVGDAVLVILGFDYGDGIVVGDVQQIVCTLGGTTGNQIALEVNLAVGDFGFHGDLADIPLLGQSWGNVLELDILLYHEFLRHHATPPPSWVRSMTSPILTFKTAQIRISTDMETSSLRFSLVMVFGAMPAARRRSALLICLSMSSFQSLL